MIFSTFLQRRILPHLIGSKSTSWIEKCSSCSISFTQEIPSKLLKYQKRFVSSMQFENETNYPQLAKTNDDKEFNPRMNSALKSRNSGYSFVSDHNNSKCPHIDNEKEHISRLKGHLAFRIHNIHENDPIIGEKIFEHISNRELSDLVLKLEAYESSLLIKKPSNYQLRLLLISSCIPFIGFGFVDNFIMIVAGDFFDTGLCVVLGFSTMAAAALGNLISDIFGIGLGGYIERVALYIGIPQPTHMTKQQLEMGISRAYYYSGSCIGIVIGCILGMVPLLFIDTSAAERLKSRKDRDELFGLVVEEIAKYLDAEKVVLYLVVDRVYNGESPVISSPGYVRQYYNDISKSENDVAKMSGVIQNLPSANLHIEVEKKPEPSVNTESKSNTESQNTPKKSHQEFNIDDLNIPSISFGKRGSQIVRKEFVTTIDGIDYWVPIDTGIIGQAYKTKKLINWRPSVPQETAKCAAPYVGVSSPATSTDCFPHDEEATNIALPDSEYIINNITHAKQILAAPVFSAMGDVIGVVEVLNPVNKEIFTRSDKVLLVTICSHLAIEIEGKQHMTKILCMCRNQVKSRFNRDNI